MIDGLYTIGLDYDAYRKDDFYQPIVHKLTYPSPLSFKTLIVLIISSSLLFIFFSLYTLTCIPYFDVKEISFVSLHDQQIPPSVIQQVEKKLIGTSYFSPLQRKVKHLLNEQRVVDEVFVKRGKKRSIEVFVGVKEIDALYNINGNYYGLIGSSFFQLIDTDISLYTQHTIQIKTSQLPSELYVEDFITYLTQKDIHQEDVQDGVVSLSEIYIPIERITLRIKENISFSRLHYVLQLIRLERDKSLITNISLHSKVCYDVYNNTLRMDEWR